MLDWLWMHINEIASTLFVLGVFFGSFGYFYKKLHKDIQEVRDELKGFIKESTKRIDDTNARLDNLYNTMIQMLKQQK